MGSTPAHASGTGGLAICDLQESGTESHGPLEQG